MKNKIFCHLGSSFSACLSLSSHGALMKTLVLGTYFSCLNLFYFQLDVNFFKKKPIFDLFAFHINPVRQFFKALLSLHTCSCSGSRASFLKKDGLRIFQTPLLLLICLRKYVKIYHKTNRCTYQYTGSLWVIQFWC